MNTQQLKIQIPKPCHERWSAMSPTAKGAFCQSCVKTVVDFSKMSDRELVQFLSKPGGANTCGRFHKHQVNRVISYSEIQNPWYKRLRHFALGVMLSIGLPGLVKAKTSMPAQVSSTFSDDSARILPASLQGYVYDHNGTPLADARIVLIHQGSPTAVTATTDENGWFVLKITGELAWNDVYLNISAKNHMPVDLAVHADEEIVAQLLPFEMPHYIMGDVIIDKNTQGWELSLANDEISGEVFDGNGHPIGVAEVFVEGGQIATTTDLYGRFTLILPEDFDFGQEIGLFVNALGYKTYFTRLDTSTLGERLHIVLQLEEEFLIGLIIKEPVPIQDLEKPHGFNINYSEPEWKQEGFNSKREFLEWKKSNQ